MTAALKVSRAPLYAVEIDLADRTVMWEHYERGAVRLVDRLKSIEAPLWELLDRIGVCIPYPELAGPA